MESERRLVTVMFADISGFTAMSEKMDPEELTDIMNECFHMMEACIDEYGGTIDKFMGDCVMALFGAPKSLEDAPHRAVNTALEMMKRNRKLNEEKTLATPLHLHIGINSGPVIAGMMGGERKQDFTVMGDTVNLASRMANIAESGTVLVAENTYLLTEGYFEFEPLGDVSVKGKEQPLSAYRVVGPLQVRTRIEACLAKGLTPFVGRSREIALLNECFEQAKEGHGQVVGVVGEPGVGKSRLVCEFRESLSSNEYIYLEGGCLHYGEIIPYLPILDILRDYFNIHEDDSEDAVREKISNRIDSFGSDLGAVKSATHELLSLPVEDPAYAKLEPRQRREIMFEAIRLLVTIESQKKPLVVVVEDLHWIDKTSEEFLSYLINSLANTHIMLILLYRPEYTHAWVGKSYYTQVRVSQLSVKASEELVKAILMEGEVVSELSGLVVERAAGNPLFIEELTHSLMENGSIEKRDNRYILARTASHIQVPATIQGIIASRLDRLEGTLKRIMQVASVIGREFAFRILQAVASLKEDVKTSLLTLQDLEFIYEKSLFPELEYIFKHALTREVAYNSLLIRKRKEIHEKVGHAIEQIYVDRLEEFYEMLAYHFSMSENIDKAYTYLKLSADKATKNYSNWEAIKLSRDAIKMLDMKPSDLESKQQKMQILNNMINSLTLLGYPEGSKEVLEEMERLACELVDKKSLVLAYGALGYYYTFKGDTSQGLDYTEKCFYEADKTGDLEIMANSAFVMCNTLWWSGDIPKLAEISKMAYERIAQEGKEKDLYEGGINLYSGLCAWHIMAIYCLGEFDRGKAVFQRGIKNATEVSDLFSLGLLEMAYAALFFWEGDGHSAVDHAYKSSGFFEQAGSSFVSFGWVLLGLGHALLGEHETARTLVEKSITYCESTGLSIGLAWLYCSLAIVHALSGQLNLARDAAEKALRFSSEHGEKFYEGVTQEFMGWIIGNLDRTHRDETIQHIQKGIAIFNARKGKGISVLGHLFLGEILSNAGNKEEALEELNTAAGMYRDMSVDSRYYWPTRVQAALEKVKTM